MALQTVIYRTTSMLQCSACLPASVIVCLTSEILEASDETTIPAEITAASLSTYSGTSYYSYTIEYDDELISIPKLRTSDIGGLFCDGCLKTYIDQRISPCWTQCSTEEELIAANESGSAGASVVSSITLTEDLEVNIPLQILPCGMIITDENTLTIVGPFDAPLYQCFDTDIGEVLFAPGATDVIYPQCFGALGDGVDDTAPIQQMIAAVSTLISVSGDYDAQARIHFPCGDYKITQTLNFTGYGGTTGGFNVSGVGTGSILRFATTNTPGIDLTGSRRALFKELQMIAVTTGAPNVMILMARTSTEASAGWHKFEKCEFTSPNSGTVFKALIYAYGSEDLEFDNCNISLVNPQVIGYYLTTINDLAVVSAYKEISTGEQGCKHHLIQGGTVADNLQSGVDSARAMYLHNARNVTVHGECWQIAGDHFIYVKSIGPNNIVDALNLVNTCFEWRGTNPNYLILGDASNDSWALGSLKGCTLIGASAIIREPTTSSLYLGLIQGNQIAGVAPTYMINTDGYIYGGQVDAFGLSIRADHIYGAAFTNVRSAAGFVVTQAHATTFSTSGATDEKLGVYADLAINGGSYIRKHVTGTTTWDPGSIADGAVTSTTLTVTGAVVGDTVTAGFSTAVPAGALLVPAVTAANTVTVTLFNKTGAPLDLVSGTLRADCWGH